jgi:hypothetical protein
MTTLERLAQWYQSNCDGDWEHGYGIKIDTLDNPGWRVNIDVRDTPLEDQPFDAFESQYSHDRDWLRCWKEDRTFKIACGPARLEDGLKVFLDWADKSAQAG